MLFVGTHHNAEKVLNVIGGVLNYPAVAAFFSFQVEKFCLFLKTSNFIFCPSLSSGKLSPENLQRITLEAVNTTQEYVKYGYQWIVEQVNSGSPQ